MLAYARAAVAADRAQREPNWRHPKIQGLIGSEARLRITIDLIWKILEDPNQEFTASDMEYWDTIHDKLKDALSTKPAAPPPEISTKHGPWVESTLHEGETYCKRCRTRSIFAGDRECDPHIVAAPAAPQPAQQPLTDEQIKDIHWSKPMDEFQFARAIEQAHGIGVKND